MDREAFHAGGAVHTMERIPVATSKAETHDLMQFWDEGVGGGGTNWKTVFLLGAKAEERKRQPHTNADSMFLAVDGYSLHSGGEFPP